MHARARDAGVSRGVTLCPGDDRVGVVDRGAVVEDEDRDEERAGQRVHLAPDPALQEAWQVLLATGP